MERVVRAGEKRVGVPMEYLRRIGASSRTAFLKFGMFLPLAGHRRHVPKATWHLARLAATQAQDCGTCVQVVVNDARRDGVPAGTLQAALAHLSDPAGVGTLSTDDRLALDYGRAIARRDPERPALVDAVRQRWSEDGLVELALAVATVQVFPLVKRGMGMDVACSLVTVEV